ncbi:contactin-associated protein-like 5 [Tachysurus ichikawai]
MLCIFLLSSICSLFQGNVTFSCSDSQREAVTFLSATNSFLALPTDWAAEGLSVRLQFRTWNQDGCLLTVPLTQGPKSSSLTLQFSRGLFLLTVRGIPQGTAQISTGPGLCDGQWHSVAVEVKGQQVYLTVDIQKPLIMEIIQLTNSLQRTTVIFGGCPVSHYDLGCEKPHTGYQGCLRLIFINNQPIGLSRTQQSKQTNFSELSFDICSIRDRSEFYMVFTNKSQFLKTS